uniref:Uncharacterized protein n=1 Tax=Lotharella globosa TaxID=91324 RepID=A0A7S3YDW9_9EUKA
MGCQVSKEEMTSKTEEEKIDPILVGREKQARELGFVNWYRAIDFAVACKLAKEEGKALAILFTEIPGSTQETFDFGDKVNFIQICPTLCHISAINSSLLNPHRRCRTHALWSCWRISSSLSLFKTTQWDSMKIGEF